MKLSLKIAKEYFQFSAAHFMIFNESEAEKLHGHNYHVRLEILAPECVLQCESGYFKDLKWFKKQVKAELDLLDQVIILPKNNKEFSYRVEGPTLHVTFRQRYYAFPKDEVLLLPICNTSVEQFSQYLAEKFFALFQKEGAVGIVVEVEESPGQSAICRIE